MVAPTQHSTETGEGLGALGLTGLTRWLAPWAGFVLALAVGRVLTGESEVRIDELVFGMPLSWLVAWFAAREMTTMSRAAAALVAMIGLAVGILA